MYSGYDFEESGQCLILCLSFVFVLELALRTNYDTEISPCYPTPKLRGIDVYLIRFKDEIQT